jgi:hypothetical protein
VWVLPISVPAQIRATTSSGRSMFCAPGRPRLRGGCASAMRVLVLAVPHQWPSRRETPGGQVPRTIEGNRMKPYRESLGLTTARPAPRSLPGGLTPAACQELPQVGALVTSSVPKEDARLSLNPPQRGALPASPECNNRERTGRVCSLVGDRRLCFGINNPAHLAGSTTGRPKAPTGNACPRLQRPKRSGTVNP